MHRFVVLFLIASGSVLGADAQSKSGVTEREAANLALARGAFEQIYGQGKVDLVDTLYGSDFVDDSPGGGTGRELVKEAVASFHAAMPDLRIEFEDAFAKDDRVVLRYTAHGTHQGEFMGVKPTGKAMAVRGITIFLIANGKIKTEWTEYDRLGIVRQLGLLGGTSEK